MITRLDATSELIVSRPSVGGQSMITTSNWRSTQPPIESRSTISRPMAVKSSTSVDASSSVAGATHRPGVSVVRTISSSATRSSERTSAIDWRTSDRDTPSPTVRFACGSMSMHRTR